MKKILTVILIMTFATSLYAQDNIRLPERPKNRTQYRDLTVQEHGYWTAVELGGGMTTMFNRSNMAMVDLDWVNGYRFSEFFRAGVGLGVKYLFNNDKVRTSSVAWVFPVYVNARGNFISQQDRGSVPFWSVNVGGEFRGGFLFAPTLGYRFGASRHSFTLGVGYTLSQYDTYKKNNEMIGTIHLKVGYEF